MSKFFFSLLVSNTAPEKMSHEPLEAFVDNDEGCFFHPAILPLMPYLIDEERKLLDADDLDFIDEDAEPVGKFLTTKVPQIRPNYPIRSITSLISMEDAILSSRVPLGASKAAKKITIYRVVKSSKNEKSLSSGPYCTVRSWINGRLFLNGWEWPPFPTVMKIMFVSATIFKWPKLYCMNNRLLLTCNYMYSTVFLLKNWKPNTKHSWRIS